MTTTGMEFLRCAAILSVALNASAAAQDLASPAQAYVELAGRWEGRLEYLDYGSGQWEGIPMQVQANITPDGHTLIRTASFDDGPAAGNVYIVSVSAFDPDTRVEESAFFRRGNSMATGSSEVWLEPGSAAGDWVMVAQSEATDDDRPARIRETTALHDGVLSTLKEVDFLDDDGEMWLQRNRTRLERIGQ